MKLAVTTLFIGSAAAFSPAASFGVRSSALNMAETATETKVRIAIICKCTSRGDVAILRRLINEYT